MSRTESKVVELTEHLSGAQFTVSADLTCVNREAPAGAESPPRAPRGAVAVIRGLPVRARMHLRRSPQVLAGQRAGAAA